MSVEIILPKPMATGVKRRVDLAGGLDGHIFAVAQAKNPLHFFNMNAELLIRMSHFYLVGNHNCPVPYGLLSDDHYSKRLVFYQEKFVKFLGEGTTNDKLQKFCFGRDTVNFETEKILIDGNYLNRVLHAHCKLKLLQFRQYVSFLWYVKDNSISACDVFGVIPEAYPEYFSAINIINYTTQCTSVGEFTDSYFTVEEIEEASMIFNSYLKLCPDAKIPNNVRPVEIPKTMITIENGYSDANRLGRANILLNEARAQTYLPFKIALYIPIFECLFVGNSGGELQQKVSERVAFYLETDPDKREDTFKTMKDGYNIRSKFFHGDTIPDKFTNEVQKEISRKIDHYARRTLKNIILNDSDNFLNTNNNVFEKYVSSLIFK